MEDVFTSTIKNTGFFDKKISVLLVMLSALIIFLILGVLGYYYILAVSKVATEMTDELIEVRAKNEALENKSVTNASISTTDATNTVRNETGGYQYALYLERELGYFKGTYAKKNTFTSYQYGFQFNQDSLDVPLSCELDKASVIVESPSGQQSLTVLCSWSSDRYGDGNKKIPTQIATDLNLITPITFTLSFTGNKLETESVAHGKTPRGMTFYRNVESTPKKTSYLYYFYTPNMINTGRYIFEAGEYMKYTLDLSVFDVTDEAALDAFAEKIIDQVSFVNESD